MPLEQRSFLRRWGLCWGGGFGAGAAHHEPAWDSPLCGAQCPALLVPSTFTRAQKFLQAQLPPERSRRGSRRGWSLLPWLLSPKEACPLPYRSEEERPSVPGRHGHCAARGWAGNCAAAARALTSQRTLGLGRGRAWLSQHSIALPALPFLPSFLQWAELLLPALRALKVNSSCGCPKRVPAPEEMCHPCVPRRLL